VGFCEAQGQPVVSSTTNTKLQLLSIKMA